MNQSNKLEDFIHTHPRESLQLCLIVAFLLLQSVACVAGVMLYFIFSKLGRAPWWIILGIGCLLAVLFTIFNLYPNGVSHTGSQYFSDVFKLNFVFWKKMMAGHSSEAWFILFHQGAVYVFGLPYLMAGILSTTELMKDNQHQEKIKALQQGKMLNEKKELPNKQIETALKRLQSAVEEGTVLGVSKYTGERVIFPDQYLNQILLVLGTTGAGKTITLRRFYERAMIKNYPLMIVDGKPTNENTAWLQALATKHHKKFYGFNCGNYSHYDCMSHGGYTELKDKIISLKDQWENDYYKSIAEDYLQAVFEVLQKTGEKFDLKRVVECLSHDELLNMARQSNDQDLLKRVADLGAYEQKDITGLKAHLNLLIHSELGKYFIADENTFSLMQVIQENAVVYFALPALRFPTFSKVLGKLVINDLKATIDHEQDHKKIFMIFDEFSVFAGEQVLNLVNMGRGKGVHAVFGTQGLADLNKVDADFKSQVMNCVNTIICHRLNDQDSAENVAAWIGTQNTFNLTAKVDTQYADGRHGSVRVNKEYTVHPEEIKKELRVGEVYWATKLGDGGSGKVSVKFI